MPRDERRLFGDLDVYASAWHDLQHLRPHRIAHKQPFAREADLLAVVGQQPKIDKLSQRRGDELIAFKAGACAKLTT